MNKLEWVVPKSCNVKKTVCTYSYNFYIKDTAITKNWVRHLLMKPICVDEFCTRRVVIHELESSLHYDDAIDASVVAEEKTG